MTFTVIHMMLEKFIQAINLDIVSTYLYYMRLVVIATLLAWNTRYRHTGTSDFRKQRVACIHSGYNLSLFRILIKSVRVVVS